MFLRLLSITVLCLSLSVPTSLAAEVWQPDFGDQLYVDTSANIGYLVHQNGDFVSFPVATGTRRTVRFLGQRYFAATPNTRWAAKGFTVQKDRSLYGSTGRFLRLYREGLSKTLYGIHAHADFDTWTREGNRHKSFGCIVVSENVLEAILATYELNGNQLEVTTSAGSAQLQAALAMRRP